VRSVTPDAADPASVAAFAARHDVAVVATVTPEGLPEAALVGIAALDDGTIVFDAPDDARKVRNLRNRPRAAVVIGTDGPVSVQLEGAAVIAEGAERERYGAAYEARFPRSRALAPGFVVIAVRPEWVRVYDASGSPARVTEVPWPGSRPSSAPPSPASRE
jgi:general stress protein 26